MKKLKNNIVVNNFPKILLFLFVVIILSIISVRLLFPSHAQTPFTKNEARLGTITSPASTFTDNAAPGGFGVQFGSTSSSSIAHIMIIMMENHSIGNIIGNSTLPYINNTLGNNYPQLTNSFATGHPSLPNYMTITSGTTSGINSDCGPGPGCQGTTNLVKQLDTAGISWGAYMENMPSAGYTGGDTGGSDGLGNQYYIQHHNPFVYYPDLASELITHDKPYTSMMADLNSSTPPAFIFIAPNMVDNMHDGPLSVGDTWLSRQIPLIQATNWYKQNGQILLTWDEGIASDSAGFNGTNGGHIAGLFISQAQLKGPDYTTSFNQAGLLGSIEKAYGVPYLNNVSNPANGSLSIIAP